MGKWSFEKKIVAVMLIISAFVLTVAASSLYIQIQIEEGHACGCVIPLYIFIPFLSSLGLFIGTLVYYLLHPIRERRIHIDQIVPLFLDKDEAVIVKEILKERKITQASLMRRTKMNKVKIFRILERLKQKGIIEKEPYGKTNIVKLSSEIEKSLEKMCK